MATIVDLPPVGTVLGPIAMIIVIEALDVTTTMTAVIDRLRAADQVVMSMAHLEEEAATTTPIDGTIRPLTRTLMVALTTVPRETFPHAKAAMGHVKVAHILGKSIGEEATGKYLNSTSLNAPPYVI